MTNAITDSDLVCINLPQILEPPKNLGTQDIPAISPTEIPRFLKSVTNPQALLFKQLYLNGIINHVAVLQGKWAEKKLRSLSKDESEYFYRWLDESISLIFDDRVYTFSISSLLERFGRLPSNMRKNIEIKKTQIVGRYLLYYFLHINPQFLKENFQDLIEEGILLESFFHWEGDSPNDFDVKNRIENSFFKENEQPIYFKDLERIRDLFITLILNENFDELLLQLQKDPETIEKYLKDDKKNRFINEAFKKLKTVDTGFNKFQLFGLRSTLIELNFVCTLFNEYAFNLDDASISIDCASNPREGLTISHYHLEGRQFFTDHFLKIVRATPLIAKKEFPKSADTLDYTCFFRFILFILRGYSCGEEGLEKKLTLNFLKNYYNRKDECLNFEKMIEDIEKYLLLHTAINANNQHESFFFYIVISQLITPHFLHSNIDLLWHCLKKKGLMLKFANSSCATTEKLAKLLLQDDIPFKIVEALLGYICFCQRTRQLQSKKRSLKVEIDQKEFNKCIYKCFFPYAGKYTIQLDIEPLKNFQVLKVFLENLKTKEQGEKILEWIALHSVISEPAQEMSKEMSELEILFEDLLKEAQQMLFHESPLVNGLGIFSYYHLLTEISEFEIKMFLKNLKVLSLENKDILKTVFEILDSCLLQETTKNVADPRISNISKMAIHWFPFLIDHYEKKATLDFPIVLRHIFNLIFSQIGNQEAIEYTFLLLKNSLNQNSPICTLFFSFFQPENIHATFYPTIQQFFEGLILELLLKKQVTAIEEVFSLLKRFEFSLKDTTVTKVSTFFLQEKLFDNFFQFFLTSSLDENYLAKEIWMHLDSYTKEKEYESALKIWKKLNHKLLITTNFSERAQKFLLVLIEFFKEGDLHSQYLYCLNCLAKLKPHEKLKEEIEKIFISEMEKRIEDISEYTQYGKLQNIIENLLISEIKKRALKIELLRKEVKSRSYRKIFESFKEIFFQAAKEEYASLRLLVEDLYQIIFNKEDISKTILHDFLILKDLMIFCFDNSLYLMKEELIKLAELSSYTIEICNENKHRIETVFFDRLLSKSTTTETLKTLSKNDLIIILDVCLNFLKELNTNPKSPLQSQIIRFSKFIDSVLQSSKNDFFLEKATALIEQLFLKKESISASNECLLTIFWVIYENRNLWGAKKAEAIYLFFVKIISKNEFDVVSHQFLILLFFFEDSLKEKNSLRIYEYFKKLSILKDIQDSQSFFQLVNQSLPIYQSDLNVSQFFATCQFLDNSTEKKEQIFQEIIKICEISKEKKLVEVCKALSQYKGFLDEKNKKFLELLKELSEKFLTLNISKQEDVFFHFFKRFEDILQCDFNLFKTIIEKLKKDKCSINLINLFINNIPSQFSVSEKSDIQIIFLEFIHSKKDIAIVEFIRNLNQNIPQVEENIRFKDVFYCLVSGFYDVFESLSDQDKSECLNLLLERKKRYFDEKIQDTKIIAIDCKLLNCLLEVNPWKRVIPVLISRILQHSDLKAIQEIHKKVIFSLAQCKNTTLLKYFARILNSFKSNDLSFQILMRTFVENLRVIDRETLLVLIELTIISFKNDDFRKSQKSWNLCLQVIEIVDDFKCTELIESLVIFIGKDDFKKWMYNFNHGQTHPLFNKLMNTYTLNKFNIERDYEPLLEFIDGVISKLMPIKPTNPFIDEIYPHVIDSIIKILNFNKEKAFEEFSTKIQSLTILLLSNDGITKKNTFRDATILLVQKLLKIIVGSYYEERIFEYIRQMLIQFTAKYFNEKDMLDLVDQYLETSLMLETQVHFYKIETIVPYILGFLSEVASSPQEIDLHISSLFICPQKITKQQFCVLFGKLFNMMVKEQKEWVYEEVIKLLILHEKSIMQIADEHSPLKEHPLAAYYQSLYVSAVLLPRPDSFYSKFSGILLHDKKYPKKIGAASELHAGKIKIKLHIYIEYLNFLFTILSTSGPEHLPEKNISIISDFIVILHRISSEEFEDESKKILEYVANIIPYIYQCNKFSNEFLEKNLCVLKLVIYRLCEISKITYKEDLDFNAELSNLIVLFFYAILFFAQSLPSHFINNTYEDLCKALDYPEWLTNLEISFINGLPPWQFRS